MWQKSIPCLFFIFYLSSPPGFCLIHKTCWTFTSLPVHDHILFHLWAFAILFSWKSLHLLSCPLHLSFSFSGFRTPESSPSLGSLPDSPHLKVPLTCCSLSKLHDSPSIIFIKSLSQDNKSGSPQPNEYTSLTLRILWLWRAEKKDQPYSIRLRIE